MSLLAKAKRTFTPWKNGHAEPSYPTGGTTAPIEDRLDETLDLLSNSRRRLTIAIVANADGPIDLPQVSRQIAGVENGKPPRKLHSQEYKRVYVGMYQTHVDILEKADAVVNDNGMIEPGPRLDEYYTLLGRIQETVEEVDRDA